MDKLDRLVHHFKHLAGLDTAPPLPPYGGTKRPLKERFLSLFQRNSLPASASLGYKIKSLFTDLVRHRAQAKAATRDAIDKSTTRIMAEHGMQSINSSPPTKHSPSPSAQKFSPGFVKLPIGPLRDEATKSLPADIQPDLRQRFAPENLLTHLKSAKGIHDALWNGKTPEEIRTREKFRSDSEPGEIFQTMQAASKLNLSEPAKVSFEALAKSVAHVYDLGLKE